MNFDNKYCRNILLKIKNKVVGHICDILFRNTSNKNKYFLGFIKRPEVTEDFVRNFLVRMNMVKTLDQFQTEW